MVFKYSAVFENELEELAVVDSESFEVEDDKEDIVDSLSSNFDSVFGEDPNGDTEDDEDVIMESNIEYIIALETALTKEKRDSLPDSAFGLSSERKYPLDTKERIRSAIQYFNHCKNPKDKKILARNIVKRIEETGGDISIGKDSEIRKFVSIRDKFLPK